MSHDMWFDVIKMPELSKACNKDLVIGPNESIFSASSGLNRTTRIPFCESGHSLGNLHFVVCPASKGVRMKMLTDWRFALLLVLTLGLAPYRPEPHIVGKIRWVAGGAVGMQPMDWLDLAFHGIPWLLLLYVLARMILKTFSKKPSAES